MVFIPMHDGCICTASEDGTLRVWCMGMGMEEPACVAILTGHLGSVWGLSYSARGLIHSAGSDGCVKTWHLLSHLHTSPNPPLRRVQQGAIPPWTYTVPDTIHTPTSHASSHTSFHILSHTPPTSLTLPSHTPSRRQNGVNSVYVSDDGDVMAVICNDGMVWLVYTYHHHHIHAYTWCPVMHTHRSVVCGDVKFKSDYGDRDVVMDMVMGHNDGVCTYIHASHTLITSPSPSPSPATIHTHTSFTTHAFKCVNTWLVYGYGHGDSDVHEHGYGLWVCTATTQGVCALWSIHGDGDCHVSKLLDIITQRKEIASSVLVLHTHQTKHLVLGDSRGGISIYTLHTLNYTPSHTPSLSIIHTQYFHRIHAKDPVSVLHTYAGGFVSAGHDGCVCFFTYTCTHTHHEADGDDGDADVLTYAHKDSFVHMNTMSAHPVHTPDMIYIPPNTHTQLSLIVGGYHSSNYIVYDVFQNTQHMCIEGGGWKRPHACVMAHTVHGIPEVLFVCPVPQGKHDTHIQVFGNLGIHKYQSLSSSHTSTDTIPLTYTHLLQTHAHTSSHPSPHPSFVPYTLQRNSSFFGKVVYCAITIHTPDGAGYMVVGGEDCTVKVCTLPSLSLIQEATLYKNSSLRALAHSHTQNDASRGIVLGGGGKLLFYIWMYNFHTHTHAHDQSLLPLRKVHVASVHPQATQDHRINAAQVTYTYTYMPHRHTYVLVLADSRGVVSILRCDVDYTPGVMAPCTVHAVHTIDVSVCPLLCCNVHMLPTHTHNANLVCVVGDTKGDVHMLLLPCTTHAHMHTDEDSDAHTNTHAHTDFTLGMPCLIASHHTHLMGTNAVCMSIISHGDGYGYGCGDGYYRYDLMLSSGGDDQSLSCRRLVLAIHTITPEVRKLYEDVSLYMPYP
ncbi:hypothetical protein EON63_09540 [archaeon]|nr:MAG: hypothetical protein EON63_09540 [archaeon]